jgi:hypothetical protein
MFLGLVHVILSLHFSYPCLIQYHDFACGQHRGVDEASNDGCNSGPTRHDFTDNSNRVCMKSSWLHPLFGPRLTPIFSLSEVCKVMKFLLNLGMKCWNSALNKCTRFKSNYSSWTGRSSENICSRSGGADERGGQIRMKLSLPPKKIGAFLSCPPP